MIYRNVAFAMLVAFVSVGFHAHMLHAQEPDAETKAQIAKRDQLWERALEVVKAGKLDEGTELIEQVYAMEESIFGTHDVILILAYSNRV